MTSSFDILYSEVMESFPDGPDVFLLQVGAGDGITGDFLHPYLIRKGWRALLLEPHAPVFARLCRTYEDLPAIQCIQMAISDRDGIQDFYSVRDIEGLPWWADQIHSLQPDVVFSHHEHIPELRDRIQVSLIPCQTISTLINSFELSQVDIVAVDTEGLDAVVVADVLRAGLQPQAILFEHKHLNHDVRQALLPELLDDYLLVEGPWDTLCVRRGSRASRILDRSQSGRDASSSVRTPNEEINDPPSANDFPGIQTPVRKP